MELVIRVPHFVNSVAEVGRDCKAEHTEASDLHGNIALLSFGNRAVLELSEFEVLVVGLFLVKEVAAISVIGVVIFVTL